ncbi:NAD(P)H-dependent oxidoreductase [Ornithinimicrobium cavernae]|uniref:NAD(P)H-dependent oxidoreductase n=1 Tax=Ornithinimicrobium cavernae TaxID=2666047 RepID=UPI000D687421|nr:NAD(P)H-dependent oxidoreductase [Ornithinimicrobium cavernae]
MSTVILVGNPRAGSRTATLATTLTQQLAQALPAVGTDSPEVLELADLAGITFTDEPAVATSPHPDPWGVVRSATVLVVATPTYKGTYTGLLKVFLDAYQAGDLAGVLAVPVAIAGKPDHQESVGATLRDLLVELGASVPAPPLVLLEPQVPEAAEHVTDWVREHAHALDAALSTVGAVR